jgi:hypothetical protein
MMNNNVLLDGVRAIGNYQTEVKPLHPGREKDMLDIQVLKMDN